jgi:putative PIN family toxin of toxin-antitoxin system
LETPSADTRPKIVLDTSVLIAALRSGSGASAAALIGILRLDARLLLSYALLCEYRDVALRPDQLAAFQRTAQEVESLIAELEELAEPLPFAERHRPISPDPDDDLVLEAAINGRADLILSHNTRHLRQAAARFKIEVVTPREFLQLLRHEE